MKLQDIFIYKVFFVVFKYIHVPMLKLLQRVFIIKLLVDCRKLTKSWEGTVTAGTST